MRLTYALVLIVTLALAVPVSAEECIPTTSNPEVDIGGQYVDNDLCQPECLFSIWFYSEANGIEGLQRGDEVVDDTCGGMIDSDVLTFY